MESQNFMMMHLHKQLQMLQFEMKEIHPNSHQFSDKQQQIVEVRKQIKLLQQQGVNPSSAISQISYETSYSSQEMPRNSVYKNNLANKPTQERQGSDSEVLNLNFDFINGLPSNFQFIKLSFGIFDRLRDFWENLFQTKLYRTEPETKISKQCVLNEFSKQQFQLIPNSSLVLFVALDAWDQENVASHKICCKLWTVHQLFDDNRQRQAGRIKLPFFSEGSSVNQLYEYGLESQPSCSLCLRVLPKDQDELLFSGMMHHSYYTTPTTLTRKILTGGNKSLLFQGIKMISGCLNVSQQQLKEKQPKQEYINSENYAHQRQQLVWKQELEELLSISKMNDHLTNKYSLIQEQVEQPQHRLLVKLNVLSNFELPNFATFQLFIMTPMGGKAKLRNQRDANFLSSSLFEPDRAQKSVHFETHPVTFNIDLPELSYSFRDQLQKIILVIVILIEENEAVKEFGWIDHPLFDREQVNIGSFSDYLNRLPIPKAFPSEQALLIKTEQLLNYQIMEVESKN